MAGNDTVMRKCDYHCAHPTGWTDGGGTEMKCCWCNKKVTVPTTFEDIPEPGHGIYSAERTKVYDWPRGWGFRDVILNLPAHV